MFATIYSVLVFSFYFFSFLLTVSLVAWAIWGKYMPRVIYGSLGLLALLIYVWWLANYLSSVPCLSPGPGCGGREFLPVEFAVVSAYILLAYSVIAIAVALIRKFLGRQIKKLTLVILIVVMVSVLILVTDSFLFSRYSNYQVFNNYNLNIPAISTALE